MAKSHPKTSLVASRSIRKQPGAIQRLRKQGIGTIETVLGSGGGPVLGLYLHTAHNVLLKSLASASFKSIMPRLIGTPALLAKFPGLSQIELAALLGTERATAGQQVSQCIAKGFVRRVVSNGDSRRYELYITDKGERLLAAARKVIPAHEQMFGAALTVRERKVLRRLLLKLIAG